MKAFQALTTSPLFYLFSFVFLISGVVLISIFTKQELHLLLNSFHHGILDVFFRILTVFGDFRFAIFIALILLFNNFRRSIMLLVSASTTGILVQFLKRVIFADALRPVKFFENSEVLKLVEGVKMHAAFSFPSGHAAVAFAIACSLVLFYPRVKYQIILFATAFLAAFSRVYLSLHFFEDILAGAFIGIICSTLCCTVISFISLPWFEQSFFKGKAMVK